MKNTKRKLTNEEKIRTERLKKIWLEKKKELNLTQEKAGLECGWNGQSAFSQYLGGHAAITIQVAIKLAKVLKVEPSQIMPEIADLIPNSLTIGTTQETSHELTQEAIEFAKAWQELPPEQKNTLAAFVYATQKPIKKIA